MLSSATRHRSNGGGTKTDNDNISGGWTNGDWQGNFCITLTVFMINDGIMKIGVSPKNIKNHVLENSSYI